jgi:hypothetical protein
MAYRHSFNKPNKQMSTNKTKLHTLAQELKSAQEAERKARSAFYEHAFTSKSTDKQMIEALTAAGVSERKATNSVKSHRQLFAASKQVAKAEETE